VIIIHAVVDPPHEAASASSALLLDPASPRSGGSAALKPRVKS
jgi:hypothetical protein